jgi:hypothetical protein
LLDLDLVRKTERERAEDIERGLLVVSAISLCLCIELIARRSQKFRFNRRWLEAMQIQLTRLAHARSGDKGDTANIGLIALRDEYYPLLVREVTAERVKEHFRGICKGEVERFELPNLGALNFLLHESLGGGGTLSLMTDAQGKTFSTALLRMKINIPDDEARALGLA